MEKNKEFDSTIGVPRKKDGGFVWDNLDNDRLRPTWFKCLICDIDYSLKNSWYWYCDNCKHYFIKNSKYTELSDDELSDVLMKRGFDQKGLRVHLISKLHNDDYYMKQLKPQLINECKNKGLDCNGNKKQLIQALHLHNGTTPQLLDGSYKKIYKSKFKPWNYRILLLSFVYVMTNTLYNGRISGWEGAIGAIIVGVIYTIFDKKNNNKEKSNDNNKLVSNLSNEIDIPD
jgi:hypothetical protein